MSLENVIKNTFDKFNLPHMEHWDKFISLGSVYSFSKGSILKEAYQTEKSMNILISGIGTSSVWDDNNTRKCTDLAFKSDFIMDYHSFINQQPTPIENQLLTDSKIFSVPHKAFIKLLDSSPYGDKITRIITDFHFAQKQKQQIDLLTKSSTERLRNLIIQYPDYIHHIPKKVIASYLGITPQSFSRIIKNSDELNIW